MKMSTVAAGRNVLASVGVIAIAIVLCGCPSAENQSTDQRKETPKNQNDSVPDKTIESQSDATAGQAEETIAPELKPESSTPKVEPSIQKTEPSLEKTEPSKPAEMVEQAEVEAEAEVQKGPRDLGPPLVDDQDRLTALAPEQPLWFDTRNKQVVLLGEVCQRDVLLEYFASNAMKAYESVLTVNVTPELVHTALLRVGAKTGQPVRFRPRFSPPTGTEIAIEVRWKDKDGKVLSAPAQYWIRDVKTKKQMDVNWVFAGSFFRKNEETGQQYYQANYGALICLVNMPEAMLDIPVESFGAVEARSYEMYGEHMPPPGTPTTIILKPIFDGKQTAEKAAPQPVPAVESKLTETKRLAVEAADAWLDLIDNAQYSRAWETGSQRLNALTKRRDFIKELNYLRKPLGKVESRQMLAPQYTRTIPNAPDGQYMIILYKSVFSKNPSVIEKVTLMRNGDKKWRVLGYHHRQ